MEYTLDLFQTLEAILWADDIVLILLAISSRIMFPILVYIALCKAHKSYKVKIVTTFLLVVMSILSFLAIFGNGWYINGDTLHLKAYNNSANIKIRAMEICKVDFYGEWEPIIRTNAASLPLLSVGKYRLKNGKTALVFVHHLQEKILLIHANKTYYIIGHYGVKKLYSELIRLGASEKNKEIG